MLHKSNGDGNGNGVIVGDRDADHLPPQNLEAERAVLGALLIEPARFAEVAAIVSAGDFYRDAHQVVFRAMQSLVDAGKPIDIIILVDEMTAAGTYGAVGGDESLLEISNAAPHAANVLYHAQIVAQKAAMRSLIEGSTEVIRDGYSNQYSAREMHDRAVNRLASVPEILREAEPWPELALQHEPDAPPFPADVFPIALERYCRGAAAATLAPTDVAGAAMLAAASAAIGQSVNIHLKRTWHESPLLYLLIVAEPGKSKTPPMKLVVKPLTQIDGELRTRSKLEKQAWEELKKAVKGAPSEPEPAQLRAVVKDITRETLVAILADNPRGVLADPDEATGWVGSFNEYKGKGTDRQFWLDLWSSRAISVDREGGRRSSWVACPFVTVLGGLPPDMLSALGEEHGRNDGFHDRLLFVFPSSFPKQEWIEDELDAGDETTWHAVLRKLHQVGLYFDEDRKLFRPQLVDFTPAAKSIWTAWYNAHCAEMEAEDAPLWLPGVWSKLRAYCARFALILSRLRLATNPELPSGDVRSPVNDTDVRGAIRLVDYFKGHIARVQHRITGGTGNRDSQAILAWIMRRRVAEFREALIREDLRRRFPDMQSLELPLKVLAEAGAIRVKADPARSGKRGPKPSRTFEVHPNLLTALERPIGAPEITEITAIRPETPY